MQRCRPLNQFVEPFGIRSIRLAYWQTTSSALVGVVLAGHVARGALRRRHRHQPNLVGVKPQTGVVETVILTSWTFGVGRLDTVVSQELTIAAHLAGLMSLDAQM